MTMPPVPDFAAFIESDPRDLPEPVDGFMPCPDCGDDVDEDCWTCDGSGAVTDASMRLKGLTV